MAKIRPTFNFGANAKRSAPKQAAAGKGKSRPPANKGKKSNAWAGYTGGGSRSTEAPF